MNILTLKNLIFAGKTEEVKECYKDTSPYSIMWYGEHHGENMLHWAASANNIELCRFAIESNIEVNVDNARGVSPLFYASARNNKEAVEYLLSVGADPYIRNGFSEQFPIHVTTDPEIKTMLQKSMDASPVTLVNNHIQSKQGINKVRLYLYKSYRRLIGLLYNYLHFGRVRECDMPLFIKDVDDIYKTSLSPIDKISKLCHTAYILFTKYERYRRKCLWCRKNARQRCSRCKSVRFCNRVCQYQAHDVHSVDCNRD